MFKNTITPKNDIIFKKIFGQKGNEGILKDFLEGILNIKIESLEVDLAKISFRMGNNRKGARSNSVF